MSLPDVQLRCTLDKYLKFDETFYRVQGMKKQAKRSVHVHTHVDTTVACKGNHPRPRMLHLDEL